MILDTNIVLYHSRDLLSAPLAKGVFAVSFVTEIEVLGFPGITPEEDAELRRMLTEDITVINLNDQIKERAIQLRRSHNVKLPDALIAATALELKADLVTNDMALSNIPGLTCRSIPLKPPGSAL